MVSQTTCPFDSPSEVTLRVFHGLACLFTLSTGYEALVRRQLEVERDTAWQVLAERERQYETSRLNVEAINARVHDIRHAIGRLADDAQIDRRVLADIIREVDVYGSTLRTGNAALDTLLSEKGLAFQREGITLSCVADGTMLNFMAPGDVYALFSTLLDEAAERTMTLPEGRSISLNVREALGATSIHVECSEMPNSSRRSERLGAMAPLREAYGATLSSSSKDSTWQANLLFPFG